MDRVWHGTVREGARGGIAENVRRNREPQASLKHQSRIEGLENLSPRIHWSRPFGTTNPSPDAPATPLLLGTDNEPVNPGADELPRTGAARDLVPLGTLGASLLAAGAAGMWWSARRQPGRTAP
jgi:hypothetical protein